jgi:hypothetical protein
MLLSDLRIEALDLALMHQQLARPIRVVCADAVRELVRRDVHTVEPHLTAEDAGIRIGHLNVALAHRLHFASEQHDAALEGVFDRVVVARLAIAGNHPVHVLRAGLVPGVLRSHDPQEASGALAASRRGLA